MKKSRKIMISVVMSVMLLVVVFTTSFVNAAAITPDDPRTGTEISGITDLGGRVWSTLAVIVQIAAIAAIVFAGVRYMFASADSKADIKKQTVILIVGAVLVFAAVPLAQFITNIANEVL